MPKKLNALMDDDRVKRLYHVLIDEDLSFTEWLRRQIDSYLAEKEGRTTSGKGGEKEGRRSGKGGAGGESRSHRRGGNE